MTPDEREALRTKVAQAIGEAFGGACMRQDGACAADLEFCGCQRATDAAFAVAEPVVREDAAKVLDARVAEIRADQAYWGGPDTTNGAVLIPELEARAAAIRARGAA